MVLVWFNAGLTLRHLGFWDSVPMLKSWKNSIEYLDAGAHTHTHSQSAPSIPTSKEALENCSAWSSTDQKKMDHPGYTIRERGTCQPCLSMWQTQNNKLHSDCPCPCPSLPSGRYQPNYNTKISLEKKSTCPTYPPFLYTFHHHEVKQLSSTRTKKMV